jgi:septal ring factor EnvC (AmiA/AmiB activator)
MSEAKDPSLLTSEELTALVEASGTGSIGGIAAIEARVLHGMSSSASQSAKHLGTLAETQSAEKTLAFSIDQTSIAAFGTAAGSAFSQAVLPQIVQNTQQIKDLGDNLDKAATQIRENAEQMRTQTGRLDHASGQIGAAENELSTIRQTLRLMEDHLQRLQRQEIMAERLQEIRSEVVALIAAEYDQRFAQLQTNSDALVSKFEELERTVRQRAEPAPHSGAEPPPPPPRPRSSSSGSR